MASEREKGMADLEERMARIEGGFEQMDRRLNHIETQLMELRTEMTTQIRAVYRTMLAILIPMWVTIIGLLSGILLKV